MQQGESKREKRSHKLYRLPLRALFPQSYQEPLLSDSDLPRLDPGNHKFLFFLTPFGLPTHQYVESSGLGLLCPH